MRPPRAPTSTTYVGTSSRWRAAGRPPHTAGRPTVEVHCSARSVCLTASQTEGNQGRSFATRSRGRSGLNPGPTDHVTSKQQKESPPSMESTDLLMLVVDFAIEWILDLVVGGLDGLGSQPS